MTLIGSFELNGIHALVGDLLLSSPVRPQGGKVLPTVGLIDEPISENKYFRGLSQKACILNENFILAWAGTVPDARSILGYLYMEFRDRNLTRDALEKSLDTIGEMQLAKLQLTGLFAIDNSIFTFQRGVREWQPTGPLAQKGLGACTAGGTGAKHIADAFTDLQTRSVDGNAMNPISSATYYGLALASDAVGSEMMGAPTLAQLFGGGFELAFLQPSGARKLDDILHMFWVWDKEVHERPRVASVFIKGDCIGTDLILQRVEIKQQQDIAEFQITSHTNYVVRRPFDPPLMAFADLGRPLPDLNCRYLCNFYHCKFREFNKIVTLQRGFRSKRGHVSITGKDGKLRIVFDKAYLDAEHTALSRILSRIPAWGT